MSLLFEDLRRELKGAADSLKAPQMQKYMKSSMPYHGVSAPLVKQICKKLFKEIEFSNFNQWQKQIQEIWDGAKFREERYAAIQLAEHKVSGAFQIPNALKLYEKMIITGAWWDYVDQLASHHVGGLLERFPKEIGPAMLKWSKSENIWKRRTSIICQLGFGKETDLKLLYACIEPSIDSKEFFLRKAIGWALRQYAWVNPREVKRYVRENGDRLSNLSRREALKNLEPSVAADRLQRGHRH
jgi:3-methyladenine DNA glycosylase AlkD